MKTSDDRTICLTQRLMLWIGFVTGGVAATLAPIPWLLVLFVAFTLLVVILYLTWKDQR